MVHNIDMRLLTPVAPALPLAPAAPAASPSQAGPTPATDQVTLGSSRPPATTGPSPVQATEPTGGLTDQETIEQLAHQMAPILQYMVPQSVLQQVAGIMSGAAQELGQPAPSVTPDAASLFISQLGLQEFAEKASERLAVSTVGERMQIMATAQALIPVLEKAAAEGSIGKVVAKPAST